MKLLLDTHTFIWAVDHTEKLSKRARELIVDPDSQLHWSAASSWDFRV